MVTTLGMRITLVLKGKKRRQTGVDIRVPSLRASEVVGPVGWLRFTGDKAHTNIGPMLEYTRDWPIPILRHVVLRPSTRREEKDMPITKPGISPFSMEVKHSGWASSLPQSQSNKDML